MKFEDLNFKPHEYHCQGVRALYKFANGYMLSVVRFPGSYGFNEGLYEAAILNKDGDFLYDYDELFEKCNESLKFFEYFCLDKTIFLNGDIMGYLTEEEVEFVLNVVENM